MNIIETKNLCYSYEEGKPALDNVSISFPKGKCTAVLGGNGAGKSTLFLNLNGVLTPDSGEVFLDGERISYRKKDLLEVRRKIGIVFQDPNDQLFFRQRPQRHLFRCGKPGTSQRRGGATGGRGHQGYRNCAVVG